MTFWHATNFTTAVDGRNPAPPGIVPWDAGAGLLPSTGPAQTSVYTVTPPEV